MHKPLIGITTNYSFDDEPCVKSDIGGKLQQWHLLADDYIRAVETAGGLPVILPLCGCLKDARETLARLDGVVFSGGNDLNPLCYGEPNSGKVGAIQPARDRQELELVRFALEETDLPVLGICRGIQLFNVAAGGTLHQDMVSDGLPPHSFSMVPMQETSQRVRIAGESLLAQIIGEEMTEVNSFHHQCIKALGRGWVPVAWDEHCPQVIEAVEREGRAAFTLGVQWHPETLAAKYPQHLKIFQAFVRAASKE